MLLPCLPTVVGTTSFGAMGSFSVWEGDVAGVSIIPGHQIFGFRPHCFDDGNKKWFREDGASRMHLVLNMLSTCNLHP